MHPSRRRPGRPDASSRPVACVLAQYRIDVVTALGRAGIRTVAVTPPDDATRASRYVDGAIDWVSHWTRQEELVERLERFGEACAVPPVLFYQSDGDLLMVSEHRTRLEAHFRFVIPDGSLVRTALDKPAFYEEADRLGIPIPASRTIRPGSPRSELSGVELPVIVKPATRRHDEWSPVAGHGKAILVGDHGRLDELLEHFAGAGVTVLVQESIPGPESRIESYHVYVSRTGERVAEFTGRKIRTHPLQYGESTALETTDAGDVRELGRDVIGRLGLRGVAKIDFKRTPAGDLKVLEVNPRFNLWHHLGAVAGVNIPAIVYADLTGAPRPETGRARAGVRWCEPTEDRHAAREAGISLGRWTAWLLGVEAKSGLSLRDPMPFVRHHLAPFVRRRLGRLRGAEAVR